MKKDIVGRNIGGNNSGIGNYGFFNQGSCNIGMENKGSFNGGCGNTGWYNATDNSNGFFCTQEPTVRLFDVDTGLKIAEAHMLIPDFIKNLPFGVYSSDEGLAVYTDEDRQIWYNNLSDVRKELIKNIPNFEPEKFHKCTGIRV